MSKRDRLCAAWPLLVVVGLWGAVVLVHADFGASWDDWIHSTYGVRSLAFFRSGGADRSFLELNDMHHYGAVVETATALVFGADDGEFRYRVRRLLFGLAAATVVFPLVAVGRRWGGEIVAVLGVLALANMPPVVGHAFVNSKDMPLAVAICLFVASILPWVWDRVPGIGDVLLSGLALGLTLAIRPSSIFVAVTLFVLALVLAPAGAARRRWACASLVVVLAWICMIVSWPYAWLDPLRHPFVGIRHALGHGADWQEMSVLYLGEAHRVSELPRSYLATYLALTLPVPTLLAAVVGLAAAARRVRTREPGWRTAAFVSCWALGPVLAWTVLRPPIYDGMRHFLFVLPPIALLAAAGAYEAVVRLPRRWGALLAALLLSYGWVPTVAMHPYQTAYFNAPVSRLFDAEYWATSTTEAIRWIGSHRARANVLLGGDVYLAGAVRAYAAPNLRVMAEDERIKHGIPVERMDLYLAPRRWGWDTRYASAPIIHTIGRDGDVYAVIRDLRKSINPPP